MKVILTQTVPKVGKEGHVVNVANGYARNYLFPRKMAVYADDGQLAILERRRVKMAAEDMKSLDNAQIVHDLLDGKQIRIEGKVAGENTRLFGAVTSQDISDAIELQLGAKVDRKQIGLVAPIKTLGKYPIEVDLHRQLVTTVNLQVFNPEAEEKAEEPEAEAIDAAEAAPSDEPQAEAAPSEEGSEDESPIEA